MVVGILMRANNWGITTVFVNSPHLHLRERQQRPESDYREYPTPSRPLEPVSQRSLRP